MARFTLTIDLPDDYDTTVAEEDPDTVAEEILRGVCTGVVTVTPTGYAWSDPGSGGSGATPSKARSTSSGSPSTRNRSSRSASVRGR